MSDVRVKRWFDDAAMVPPVNIIDGLLVWLDNSFLLLYNLFFLRLLLLFAELFFALLLHWPISRLLPDIMCI